MKMELAKFPQPKHVLLIMVSTLDGLLKPTFQAQLDVTIQFSETPPMVLLNSAPYQIVKLLEPNVPTKMEPASFLLTKHVQLIMVSILDGFQNQMSQTQLGATTLSSVILLMVLLNYVPTLTVKS